MPPALDVVGDDHGHAVAAGCRRARPARRRPSAASRSRGGGGSDMHEQPVGPVPAGERREVLVAVHGRLDVEQHEVVAAPVERGDDPAEPLDRRGVGEEGHDHAEVWQRRARGRGPAGWGGSRGSRWRRAPAPGSPSLTLGLPLSTRETVPSPTPACAATSAIVGIELPPELLDRRSVEALPRVGFERKPERVRSVNDRPRRAPRRLGRGPAR